jgi:Gpi18-like mannosyltransferase
MRGSDGRSTRSVVLVFVVTRVVLAATIAVALAFLPRAECPICRDMSEVPFLSALANWDGAAYVDIARSGYESLNPTYAAYFPVYPALMRVLAVIGGGSVEALIVAGVVISNAACLAAALLLVQAAATARNVRPVAAAGNLLTFPTTVFLSAVYADSLFIALAVASALAARRSRWWVSGALASLAALTRPFGGLAMIPLAFEMWRSRASLRPASLLSLLLAPAAFLVWLAYWYSLTGDPLAVIHGYTAGFTPRGPLQSVTDLFDPSVYGFPWIVAGSFVLFVALAAICWRVTDRGLALYASLMMVLITVAGSLTSSLRYELSVYPAFIAMAAVFGSRIARVAWMALSLALALLFAAMFALHYWVG